MKNKKNSKKLSNDSSNLFKSEINNNNTENNALSNKNSQEMFETKSISHSDSDDSSNSYSSENDNFHHHLLQIHSSYKNNLKLMNLFCNNVANQRLKRDENSS
jgi:hypothetical protein